eukprot:1281513-Prymnesium_polylepis.1
MDAELRIVDQRKSRRHVIINPGKVGKERDAVRKAYKVLATKFHPDKNLGATPQKKEELTQCFHLIEAAHETLLDKSLKEHYDVELRKEKYGSDREWRRRSTICAVQVAGGLVCIGFG